MDKRYKHLNGEEPGVILAEHRRGASLGAIGLLLGRSASTIGRELRQGRPQGNPAQPYCAQLGADQYRALCKRCGRRRKLACDGWLHDLCGASCSTLSDVPPSRLRADSGPCTPML